MSNFSVPSLLYFEVVIIFTTEVLEGMADTPWKWSASGKTAAVQKGSQTFAYQAYANRTFAYQLTPITHSPIKTYAYQKLNLKSGLLPIRVGLLPIKNWSTSVNIFVYVYIVCTMQNLNGETKKGKLFEKEVNHTDLLRTKDFFKILLCIQLVWWST